MDAQRIFLGGVAALLVLTSFLMVAPFLGYLLSAILLAFILKPLQEKLGSYIGPNIASGIIIILFISAVIAPFGIALSAVVDDAQQLVDNIGDAEFLDFDEIEELIFDYTGQEINLQQEIQAGLERFAEVAVGGFAQVVDLITGVLIGLLIMIFVLFYLLKDGEKLHAWVVEVTPVAEDLQDDLYSKAELMTWSVLKGHVLVAIIEGLIGGLGLWLAGVPNVAFWTFIMIILSFIPVVGAFLVWAPASIYLFLVGELSSALFLFVYGAVIISLADNLLRPYMVDKRAEIHPAAILIGVIGGIYVFGAVGLFIGPIIFGFSKTVLDVLMREQSEP